MTEKKSSDRRKSSHAGARRPAGKAASKKPTAAEREAVEKDSVETKPMTSAAKGHPMKSANALIGVLLAALGFAIAVQIRSVSSSDALSGARPDDLVRILDDQNSRQDRLQQQINQLQDTLRKLNASNDSDSAARDAAKRKADALGVLTGTLPATGPGVVLTITDPQGGLKAENLLDVIEELRGAGAEAIQFGPVRVTTSSAFVDTDTGVQLDGIAIKAPYKVLAIGPPQTMARALTITDGVSDTVKEAGGTAGIDQQGKVDITVVRPLPNGKYATPDR
ncbi:MAG: DUF881 domain-containing protein [Jatrophihabitans sp.]